MITAVSTNPEQQAGEYIRSKLREHENKDILLYISGGSSLNILQFIQNDVLIQNVTICMGDERFSRDDTINNFLQLKKTDFYSRAVTRFVHFIDTCPIVEESHSSFCNRIHTTLSDYYKTHTNTYTLGLFGVGEDGHTASIFPNTKKEFSKIYESKNYFVTTVQKTVPCPKRISITPTIISNSLDAVVLYAVGQAKCAGILRHISDTSIELHDMPAQALALHTNAKLFTDCQDSAKQT